MKYYFSLLALIFYINLNAQTTATTQPQYPTETDQITITFDVTNSVAPAGKGSLKNYSGTIYAYTCVGINNGTTWLHEKWTWGNTNNTQSQVTRLSEANHYQFVINNPRTFYGVTPSEKITSLKFVLKNSDGTRQTEDINIPLYSSGITVVIKSPTVTSGFGDPARSPVFTSSGSTIPISVSTAQVGTVTQSIKLLINGNQATQSTTDSLKYNFIADNHPACKNDIMIIAEDNASHKDTSRFTIMRNPAIKDIPLPEGSHIGINYESDPAKVTLAFYAPRKSYVYVIGDFGTSDWKVDTSYFMNRYAVNADSVIWWTTISNLESGKEYSYQFLVDGNLRIYDPYTEKILDGDNDQYIPASVYPGLKAYPGGKTSGLVSVLQTGQPEYHWTVPQFVKPTKEKLVIYELLIRDFVSTHWYKTIADTISYFKKLGVTAIELMPVIEFERNDSWGYNPSTYFAPDKYYGTKNDLKVFIDVCHQNGMAVIMDIVLNHAYGSNSMAQLYWDNLNNRPAADNPWFNVTPPTGSYVFGGSDFNHESKDTKYFVDRVTDFWLTEYKFDGFRFDFTKGFTNTPGEGTAYDPARIAILKRIADKIWSVSPSAYVILEHFCAANEEKELADYGMMIWGNLNYNYNEASMGWISTSNFVNISYKQRGWTFPNLVGYMESHDEERLMYKNLTYGNYVGYGSGTYTPTKDINGKIIYSIRELPTALNRIELAANLFLLVPGPKMIWQFGELGYDYSINYPSLTSSDRLTAKPVKWDYYLYSGNRRKVYNTFASLNKLKSDYPAFQSSDYVLNASGPVKSLYINHPSMNVWVMGNFDITQQDYQAAFQSPGRWYEFYSGDTLDVTDVIMKISLQPGEYRLYTTQRLIKSDILSGIKTEDAVPNSFILNQNYPNPFNPSTIISYQIPASGHVTLKVFDLLGREVVTLVDKYENAGAHNAQFSAYNSQLASGIYFYRLQAGSFVSTKKMVFIK
jgi:glycosidase